MLTAPCQFFTFLCVTHNKKHFRFNGMPFLKVLHFSSNTSFVIFFRWFEWRHLLVCHCDAFTADGSWPTLLNSLWLGLAGPLIPDWLHCSDWYRWLDFCVRASTQLKLKLKMVTGLLMTFCVIVPWQMFMLVILLLFWKIFLFLQCYTVAYVIFFLLVIHEKHRMRYSPSFSLSLFFSLCLSRSSWLRKKWSNFELEVPSPSPRGLVQSSVCLLWLAEAGGWEAHTGFWGREGHSATTEHAGWAAPFHNTFPPGRAIYARQAQSTIPMPLPITVHPRWPSYLSLSFSIFFFLSLSLSLSLFFFLFPSCPLLPALLYSTVGGICSLTLLKWQTLLPLVSQCFPFIHSLQFLPFPWAVSAMQMIVYANGMGMETWCK